MSSRKPRLYLETSVISHLDVNRDRPERTADTWRLWRNVLAGNYDAVIGEAAFNEIDACRDLADGEKLLARINEIDYVEAKITAAAVELAQAYIVGGGLKPNSRTDALHIALATLANCEVVLSWNCRHIVSSRAMKAVATVNARQNLPPVKLLTPTLFLNEERRQNV